MDQCQGCDNDVWLGEISIGRTNKVASEVDFLQASKYDEGTANGAMIYCEAGAADSSANDAMQPLQVASNLYSCLRPFHTEFDALLRPAVPHDRLGLHPLI